MEKKELLPYKPGVILQGTYKSYGSRFGFLLTDEDHEDVYIADRDHLNAVNNDIVEVKTIAGETGRHNTEGRILRVVERANDSFVCTYEMVEGGGEAVPIDEKVNMVIVIPEGQEMGATTGARVMVEVTRWPGEWTDAEGRVTEIIGYKGDKGIDIDIIIAQHRLRHQFSDELMKEADSLPRAIMPEEGVKDFRDVPIVTIDGPDSKDLDDAVYCKKKENGHFELGVHIADVSRYVKKGTLLDDEAYARGTSVYLADRVIPMLPFQLSNDLCSLNHDEDRYAMSCIMDVSPDGEVKTELITPSLVRVARRCNYPEINKAFTEGVAPDDLKVHLPMLLDLKECADALRNNRTRRGALDFDFPEYKIVLDEEGTPLRIVKIIRGDSEKMIEDAMIAANEAVARFLESTGHTSVFRVHDHPDPEKLASLKRLAAIMGLPIHIPEDPEPADIQKLLESAKGKDFEAVIQVMTLRSLPQACYSTDNNGHFGIASTCYTHFTSPIRRYPDLMVHRLIRQALCDEMTKADRKKQTEFLLRAVEHCSEMEQNATETERDVDDLKMTEYMVPFVGEPFDARITGVTRFGIFVGLDNGVEGLVHVDSMDDDEYIYQEDTMTMKGRFSGTTYAMGMPVRVTLVKADKERREVDFILGEIHSPLNLEKKTRSSSKSHSKKKNKKGKSKRKGKR
ncbi:ribonuclease R [Dialister sp.]|uniref:ribonuclease R n=1 Tax=Dialister sp. TaxID=1955814 RepID=UPI002E8162E1|nr:ribonuclease R [Dialister sp.]MEE3452456.1 ribonuclease R [Dialister sp.]